MTIGDKLKEIRNSKKISIMKLHSITGISRSTITDIENNKDRKPNTATLEKIANALSVSVDELFKEEDVKDIEDIEDTVNRAELLIDFAEPEEALKFILAQPSMQDFGGYDLRNMTDEEILDVANDMLFAMRLSLEKMKKKNR